MVNMPKNIPFAKLCATGNDFILIDNRMGHFSGKERDFFQSICRRHTGVGADGVLLIDNSNRADFRMRYFNADGGVSEMCGNGARATAFYAYHHRIAGQHMQFDVEGVLYTAEVKGGRVALQMHWPLNFKPEPGVLEHKGFREAGYAEAGVPHYVLLVENKQLENVDVSAIGKYYREHPAFAPRGTNVDFLEIEAPGRLRMRTYERGVEAETLACGTGALACAFMAQKRFAQEFPLRINTAGGVLWVEISRDAGRLVLSGEVSLPFEGMLMRDAFAAL